MRSWFSCAKALPLVLALGCATTRNDDPQSVLRSYARALDEGRAEDAYRLLSDEARRGMSFEAFRRAMTSSRDEVRELAKTLARPTAPPIVTATLTSPSGEVLRLVLENGRWRVDGAALDLYPQDSPRHAIQGFLRAIERKRWDMVLRYVPDAHSDGLDAPKLKEAWEGPDRAELEQVALALRQALGSATIEETGDRASMPYGAGTLTLVREHGLWKIEDFD